MRMPNSPKAEKYVLGTIISSLSLEEAQDRLRQVSSDMFHNTEHRRVFQMICSTIDGGHMPDEANLSSRFPDDFDLFLDLTSEVPTSVHFEDKVKVLNDYLFKRKVKKSLLESVDALQNHHKDYKEVAGELIDKLNSAVYDVADISHFTTEETIRDAQGIIEEVARGGGDLVVPYGIPLIDDYLIHLRKQMHTLGARPSIGKTAFALSCIAQQIQRGIKVAIFCGESSKEEILLRLSSIFSGLPFDLLIRGLKGANQVQIQAHAKAIQMLMHYRDNFVIYGKGSYTHLCDDIRSILKRIGNMDMVYVDYLQNIKPAKVTKRKEQHEVIEYNVRFLSDMFGEFNCAGVVLAQVNRGAGDEPPKLHHLKGSSAIEDESHIVSFLHRKPNKNAKEQKTDHYSEKTRIISPFGKELMFYGQNARYDGIMHKYSEEYLPDQQF